MLAIPFLPGQCDWLGPDDEGGDSGAEAGEPPEESEPVPECGDGEVEGDEVCDGTDLAGESCASLDPAHFAAGELRCAADCGAFDASACDAGDCCQGGSNQGCEVADIEACVCAQDSFCCETEWDTVCVAEAEDCGMVCP